MVTIHGRVLSHDVSRSDFRLALLAWSQNHGGCYLTHCVSRRRTSSTTLAVAKQVLSDCVSCYRPIRIIELVCTVSSSLPHVESARSATQALISMAGGCFLLRAEMLEASNRRPSSCCAGVAGCRAVRCEGRIRHAQRFEMYQSFSVRVCVGQHIVATASEQCRRTAL